MMELKARMKEPQVKKKVKNPGGIYTITTIQIPKVLANKIKTLYRVSAVTLAINQAVEDLLEIMEVSKAKHPAVVVDKLKQESLEFEQKIA